MGLVSRSLDISKAGKEPPRYGKKVRGKYQNVCKLLVSSKRDILLLSVHFACQ